MISIKEVTKKYGAKVVVDHVDLDLPKGKIISLIGPNGAGKSTLLGMMSRTLKKNEGHIKINDISIDDWESIELAKELAIMKQSEHIHVKITVRDLVTFGRYPYSQGKLNALDKEKIDQAIKFLDLEEMAESFIDELSGGQRQRAYIASIYAQDTEYILLDEPLNNLDIKHASNMLQLIKKLAYQEGKTIIIVIHDLNFASSFSDYIVLMDQGRVVKYGPVDEVMTSDTLEEIYDMPFKIVDVDNKKFCLYY